MSITPDNLMDRLLTVDTGNNTAYALWAVDGSLACANYFQLTSRVPLSAKLAEAEGTFDYVIEHYAPSCVLLEGVEMWESNLTSRTSAVRGDLFQLAYLVGVYSAVCSARLIPFLIVPARKWKGNLTKEATQMWVKKALEIEFPNEHVYDAVAMGLSLTNKWLGNHGLADMENRTLIVNELNTSRLTLKRPR